MAEWPKAYHPASYDGAEYVVDTSQLVEGYQLRPDTWLACATWCGTRRVLDEDGNQALTVGEALARLGDFVMRRNAVFFVEPADGHYQRWAQA